MPDLVLGDVEQRAMRDLMATEPCPGCPLPTTHVLEQLAVLVPADGVCAVFQDGTYTVTEGVFLGGADDDVPDPAREATATPRPNPRRDGRR